MAILSLVLVLSVRILAMPRSWVVIGQDCGAWVLVVLIVLSSEELLIKMPKGEIARLRLVVLRGVCLVPFLGLVCQKVAH